MEHSKPNPNQYREALDILQEECAEVIIEVSKSRLSSLNSVHYETGLEFSQYIGQSFKDYSLLKLKREQNVKN
jgi:hypothetical protein